MATQSNALLWYRRVQWQPAAPTFVTTPAGATTDLSATFVIQMATGTSVGQLSFVYTLQEDGVPFVIPGGNPGGHWCARCRVDVL
jgi:hypothetical protein